MRSITITDFGSHGTFAGTHANSPWERTEFLAEWVSYPALKVLRTLNFCGTLQKEWPLSTKVEGPKNMLWSVEFNLLRKSLVMWQINSCSGRHVWGGSALPLQVFDPSISSCSFFRFPRNFYWSSEYWGIYLHDSRIKLPIAMDSLICSLEDGIFVFDGWLQLPSQ